MAEWCFLHGSNSPPILNVFSFSSWKERSTSSIVSHSAIHEDTQASNGDAEITEYSTGNLHGRYISNGRVQTEANRIHKVTLFLLNNIRLIVNYKKDHRKKLSFWGWLWTPYQRIRRENKGNRQEVYRLLNQKQPTTQLLSQLLGKLNTTSPVLQMAHRSLQICLKQTLSDNQQDYQAVVKLSPQAMKNLQWWVLHLSS